MSFFVFYVMIVLPDVHTAKAYTFNSELQCKKHRQITIDFYKQFGIIMHISKCEERKFD